MDQEALATGELVVLLRHDPHRELFTGQVGAGQFVGLGGVRLVHVDLAGRSLCTPGLQLLQRITGELVCLGPAGGVVVGCHESHFCGSEWGARGPVTD